MTASRMSTTSTKSTRSIFADLVALATRPCPNCGRPTMYGPGYACRLCLQSAWAIVAGKKKEAAPCVH